VLLAAASVVLVLAAVFVVIEDGATALIPFGLAVVIAVTLAVQLQKRRLLSSGTAVVGRVVSSNKAKGMLGVEYEYPTPAGTLRGSTGIDLMRVRRAFGFEPGANDTVYVVFDPGQPSRSSVWGFAKR
jgi:dUTPase